MRQHSTQLSFGGQAQKASGSMNRPDWDKTGPDMTRLERRVIAGWLRLAAEHLRAAHLCEELAQAIKDGKPTARLRHQRASQDRRGGNARQKVLNLDPDERVF